MTSIANNNAPKLRYFMTDNIKLLDKHFIGNEKNKNNSNKFPSNENTQFSQQTHFY